VDGDAIGRKEMENQSRFISEVEMVGDMFNHRGIPVAASAATSSGCSVW